MKKWLYDIAPGMFRGLIASIRGAQLSRLRYGPELAGLVQEAEEREYWSREQWGHYHVSRLRSILESGLHGVPFYRRYKLQVPDLDWRDGFSNLALVPILEKEMLRREPASFLHEEAVPREMWREQTSGSTGTPVTLWQSREAVRQWYGLFEARWRGWNDLTRNNRWAIFGGQLVTPIRQKKPPYWVWNSAMGQLYCSTYHLSPASAKAYVEALAKYRVEYIWGYASAMAVFARFVLDQGLELPRIRLALSNAEPLYSHQRDVIRRAFHCPVRDTYGMSEMVCGASECEHDGMHLWPEVGIAEVLNDGLDGPARAGQAGHLVCTGLLNRQMPLIRYMTGDIVVFADSASHCKCGRTLPLIKRIEGRSDDLIVTPDGRSVGRLDPVFKSSVPIVEAQVVQVERDGILVRIVRGAGFTDACENSVRIGLTERLGGMRVSFEYLEQIPRGKNGKFKAVVSCLSGEGLNGASEHEAVDPG